ncbi:hypothetical protein GPECTOR_26g478 [Gonium pectorale]|uniref:NAD-dependent epimerase/dehydratase domain-containing protein n=1 Tax=Gonium pectorale TaxID=33097 RepID=A0A150GG48_GONPE|nr:hypothetical protein GPECTOR_26g478 [Gonium pectorale]|eukprot:KXZ48575.1 hypothetical protein GPECTOR_26g478 [Gonium pectorale]
MSTQGEQGPPFGTVLVTGASGFVGFHVVEALLQQNVAGVVRCLTRRPTPELEQLQRSWGEARVQLCVGDLLGPPSALAPLLSGCGGLVHCAAHYRWWTREPGLFAALNVDATVALMRLAAEAGVRQPGLFAALNVDATVALMRLAAEAGVRQVVHVSTVLAAGCPPGWGSAERPLTPHAPPGPTASRYAASKAAADAAVLAMAAEAGTGTGTEEGVEVEEAVAEGGAMAAGAAAAAAAAAPQEGARPGARRRGRGRRRLRACVVCLACVVGPDRRLVGGGEEDVLRIADLVRGKVPASLGHDTTFTYIGVRDAAAALVAALLRGQPGRRYLVGNQRLTTGEYFDLIARLSGTPPPPRRVPLWLAAAWARAAAGWAALTGIPPQAPPDLIRTVAYGTLLFDSSSSEAELRLDVPYRSIEEAFREAVLTVQEHDEGRGTSPP